MTAQLGRVLRMWSLFVFLAAGFFLPVVSAGSPAQAAGLEGFAGLSGELRIVGSEVGLAALRNLADQVTAACPGVRVTITPCPIGVGVVRVRTGAAQLSMAERSLPAKSLALGKLKAVPYAVDPVAFVVNPINPVSELTFEQLRNVFAGRVRSWSELGGRQEVVLPLFIDASEQEGRAEFKGWAVTIYSQPALRMSMTRNKEIIGFVSMRDVGAALKPVRVEGVDPELGNFTSGKYTVYRTLRMVCDESPSALTQAFLDLLQGPLGQKAVEEAGYLPLGRTPAVPSPVNVDWPEGLAVGL